MKARKFGIRHGIYQGEDQRQEVVLDPLTNNGTRLRHYRVTISPPTNFLVRCCHPLTIKELCGRHKWRNRPTIAAIAVTCVTPRRNS